MLVYWGQVWLYRAGANVTRCSCCCWRWIWLWPPSSTGCWVSTMSHRSSGRTLPPRPSRFSSTRQFCCLRCLRRLGLDRSSNYAVSQPLQLKSSTVAVALINRKPLTTVLVLRSKPAATAGYWSTIFVAVTCTALSCYASAVYPLSTNYH